VNQHTVGVAGDRGWDDERMPVGDEANVPDACGVE
jgi:hypothetical protein